LISAQWISFATSIPTTTPTSTFLSSIGWKCSLSPPAPPYIAINRSA